jgi:hypothetical protein
MILDHLVDNQSQIHLYSLESALPKKERRIKKKYEIDIFHLLKI